MPHLSDVFDVFVCIVAFLIKEKTAEAPRPPRHIASHSHPQNSFLNIPGPNLKLQVQMI